MSILTLAATHPVAVRFSPAPVMPTQFDGIWHRTRSRSPECALLIAMLLEARTDLRKYRHARRHRDQRCYVSAWTWVVSDDREWPFSFVNVCEVLKLDTASMRAEMLGDAAPASGPHGGWECARWF